MVAATRIGMAGRRTLFLLLGGLAAVPYALVAGWVIGIWASPAVAESGKPAVLATAIVAFALLCVPAFLEVTRTLERTAVRSLLDVDLPEPGDRASRALRGAVFFAGHVVTGGLTVAVIAFGIPTVATLAVDAVTGGSTTSEFAALLLPGVEPPLAIAGILGAVAGALLAAVGAAAIAPWCARVLLGPTPQEVERLADVRAADAARRTELARELHDTIGHALTVTTVQAAAARRSLERNPAATRVALAEIESAARRAAADLDYALGILRGDDAARRGPAATLADLGPMLDEFREAGVDLDAQLDAGAADLPASLSRELARVVQESLTNAVRHGAGGPVSLRLAIDDDVVRLVVENPAERAAEPRRGIRGMRERMTLLRGELTAGLADGTWRVLAEAPVRPRGGSG